jgi:hypothetical protein
MSQYFSNFPNLSYSLPGLPNATFATDVTKRFILRDFYRRSMLDFYRYDVIEGERPDNVAYNFYGESDLDWLILLPNEMIDPYYEWPRTQYDLNEFMRKKYGSVSNAQATTHHYEQIIQNSSSLQDEDGNTITIPERTLIVDQTTYTSLSPSSRKLITAYDYELSRNDKNRTISVIKSIYVPSIVEAFRNLYF